MPKRLSDPAWLAFQNQVDLNALALPPWGAVVQWGTQLILVYICPIDGAQCRKGEVMLTDVTDIPETVKNIPGTYDARQDTWVYHLPQELMTRTAEVAKASLENTGRVIQTVAETVGGAAGALTSPLLENLMPVMIAAAVALVFMYAPRK